VVENNNYDPVFGGLLSKWEPGNVCENVRFKKNLVFLTHIMYMIYIYFSQCIVESKCLGIRTKSVYDVYI